MEIQQPQPCPSCSYNYQTTDIFCNTCGYPLQGNKFAQDEHIANRATKEIDLMDLNEKIRKACNSLYWIAGVMVISSIIGYFAVEGDEKFFMLVTGVILVGAFLAFAVWSKSKPLTALISGLSLYVIIVLLNGIVEPTTLIKGIIFKIIIIGYLIKGITAVIEAEKIKKELNVF